MVEVTVAGTMFRTVGREIRDRAMNRIAVILAALGVLSASVHGTVSAADVVRTENVEARLISDVGAVVPGESFRVALRLEIREGWHTYWKNPGDSGEPTSIAWTLPEGFTASDIAWPPPRRLPVGPLVNYGYEGEALHLVRMMAPPDLAPGGTVTLRGDAYWLVCEDICIPEEATLELALPVAGSGPPPASEWRDDIAAAEQSLPTPSPWPATYEVSDDGVTLRIAASGLDDGRIENLTFFPAQYGVIDHAAAQDVAIDGDGVTVSAPRSPYAEPVAAPLEGVVAIEEGLDGGTVLQAFAVSAEEANALTEGRDAAPTAVLLDPEGTVGRYMYVIDETGRLVYAGGIDDKPTLRRSSVEGAHNYVQAALTAVQAGEPVATPTARPYGCTVKD